MGFKKYQSVEKTELVSKEGHEVIADELRKTGKTSVGDLSENEKGEMYRQLDED
ncbi:MAG: hypothetical protein JWR61_5797 [Ferruginibacter sp.]|nr:hypothetical protein [Ferruginibacter sp.]